MGRIFYFTESQLRGKIKSEVLDEVTLSGDEELSQTKNIQTAAKNVVDSAQNSGINTQNGGVSVSFSADSLKNNAGIQEERIKKLRENGIVLSKKKINELRIKKLKEGAKIITKKQMNEDFGE